MKQSMGYAARLYAQVTGNNIKLSSYFSCLVISLFMGLSVSVYGQNIAATNIGVNWVGVNNGYFQPINGSTDANVLQYRKVATAAVNPVDGRGQWWCTLHALSAGGDVLARNMLGGSGDGFWFTSGGLPGATGDLTNLWGLSVAGQAPMDTITPLIWSGNGTAEETGLDMFDEGYYTLVMQDSGAGFKNSRFYAGFTSNSPVTIAHNTGTQQYVLSDRSVLIQATVSATLSAEENIYVRYKVGSNDFSTGTSSILEATNINGTNLSFIIPPQTAGVNVYYYLFSSTMSSVGLAALSESDKSLACLRVADNSGNNYTAVIPAIATVYLHNFTTVPTGTPYTIAPNTFAANLSNSSWTCQSGGFLTTSTTGYSGNCLSSVSGVNCGSYTLTFNIASGYTLSVSSFNFWRSTSKSGNTITSVTINGIKINPNSISIPNTGGVNSKILGQTNVANEISNLSGTITVIITVVNGGNGGTFLLDDFTLYGNVAAWPSGLNYTWSGATSSSWNTASNWSPSGIPGFTDNITIASPGTNNLNITGSQFVNDVTLKTTGVLKMASGSSLTINGNFTYSSPAVATLDCGSTLNLASANNINIPALSYGNLNLSGGSRTFATGTLNICGNYTPSEATTTTTGCTVNFNGTAAQAININPAIFSNLIFSNNAATVTANVDVTLETGSILIINPLARLSTGAHILTITGSTVQVNGFLRSAFVTGADASTLTINNGGTFEYNESRSGQADLGVIPTATWNAGSTLSITGLTDPLDGSWFSGGMGQAFSNFTWNTASLTTKPRFDANPFTTSGTFSIQSTGTGELQLGSSSGGLINCVNFNQSGGTLNFSDGAASSSLHVSGSFSHTGGTITETGTGTDNTIYFDGTSGAQSLTGSISGNSYINYQFDNPNGFVLTGSVPVKGTAIIKAGNFSGTGKLAYSSLGTLKYDCTSPRTTSAGEWPSTSSPHNVTVTNGVNLLLDASRVSDQLTLNDGVVTLGSYDLVLNDSLGQGVIPAIPFGTDNMVMTNGTGMLGRAIANTASLPYTYLFPVGNAEYSPVSYTFTLNSLPRELMVRVVDATHPNVIGPDYIANRYWTTDLSVPTGTYTYSATYTFNAGDEQGDPANIRLSRWNGLLWSNVAASSVTVPLLNSGTATETTAPLYSPADWSGSPTGAVTQTYIWNNPAGGSWLTATNWTPSGVPTSGDAVSFGQVATYTVTNVPAGIYLTSLSFSGGGNITLQAGAPGILNINGTTSPQLSVSAGTSVTVAGSTALTINAASGNRGIVLGNVQLKGGSHSLTAEDPDSLTFENGSYFAAGVSGGTTYTGYPFGYNGNSYTAVFKSGSVCEQFEGPDPFGREDSALYINKVKFESGSLYRYSDIGAARSPYFNGRHYYDYEYNVNLVKTAMGTIPFGVNNFTLAQGTLNWNMNASINTISGDIVINGTALNMSPTVGAAFQINGTSPQTLSGTGSFTIGSTSLFSIKSGSSLKLERAVTSDGSFIVNGTLDCGTNIISGTGIASSASVASGGTIIAGDAGGLTTLGNASGNFQTTYRYYSSEASYIFTNAGGVTGNFFIVTSPDVNTVDSLGINSAGTITYSGAGIGGYLYITKLSLIDGNFSLGSSKNIFIPDTGVVRSTGGRMASGSAGGSVWFTGTSAPGTPIYGNPEFYNVVVQDTINFVDNGTVNGTMDITEAAGYVTNAPTYATGSTLRYSMGVAYNRGTEWDQLTPGLAGYPHHVSVQNGTTLNLGTNTPTNLEIGGNLQIGFPFSKGTVNMNALTQPLKVLGNVRIGSEFTSTNNKLNLSSMAGGDLHAYGSLYREGDATNGITYNNRSIIFKGSGNDSVSSITTKTPLTYSALSLYSISMQKTGSGDITIKMPVTITNTLNFSSGVINTTNTNLLAVSNAAVAAITGTPSNSSFVNGPLARATNLTSEYSFPVGASSVAVNKYRPVTVTPAATTTTTFTAEFKPATPTPNYVNQLSPNLVAIDNTCTWQISRSTSTAARISLDYKDPGTNNWITSSGSLISPDSASKVAVVQYNASTSNYWAFTTATFSGTPILERLYTDENPIYSAAAMNVSLGAFTFGLQYSAILPVRLLNFDGRLVGSDGKFGWNVADSRDLAGFELQYSKDGRSFSKLAFINNNGNTWYSFVDPQLTAGIHFYRLLVKEKSGSSFYSQVVLLTVGKLRTQIIGLRQTVVRQEIIPQIISASNQPVRAEIMDALGRMISRQQSQLMLGDNQWRIQIPALAAGIYFVHLRTADGEEKTLKFVKE